jgi:hypothetical protein
MAKATKRRSQAQPTLQPATPAKAQRIERATAKATAIATETRVLKDGTIQRYAHGHLISTTPAPPATPAKAQPPKTPAAPTGPTPGETYIIGPLDGDDLWEFAPASAEPGAAVVVRRYQGYTRLREHRRSAAYAAKLSKDLLDRGYVWIDGVHYKLVDED